LSYLLKKYDNLNPSDRLIFLGTKGGPSIRGPRLPSANAVIVDGVPFILDTGYGASLRVFQANVPLISIRHILLTHLHSDHCIEAGPLLYNAWVNGLSAEVDMYGPEGVAPMMAAYWESLRYDIGLRIADEGRPDLRKLVRVHTYAEGRVSRRTVSRSRPSATSTRRSPTVSR
jgi:ribonuclease BN (tRNA processing enzyme)